MALTWKTPPANVQITVTNTNGENRRVIYLMEGDSILSMTLKLIPLEGNNIIVHSVKLSNGSTKEEYINEWKKLVSEDKTTDSLEDWYSDAYL